MRKALPFAALLALAPLARADRLITIPTARKLLDGSVRLESMREFGHFDRGTDYLAAAFGQAWEAEARVLRGPDFTKGTVDLTYNVVAAIPGFSPGISAGVQDLAAATSAGPRAFVCLTNRVEANGHNTPFDVTSGLFVGKRTRPFVGTTVPMYPFLRLLAEHNGDYGSVGFEATPFRGLRLRLVGRSGAVLGSLGYTAKF